MSLFSLFMMFLAIANAFYISPNPWTTTTAPVNTTQAAMLLARRDRGSLSTIYANGQFLDSAYASFFSCALRPTSTSTSPSPRPTQAPPPNPESGTGLPPPLPAPATPTPSAPGSDSTCNPGDKIIDIDLPIGSKPATYSKDDMRDLFTDACNHASHYPIDGKHKDHTYSNQNGGVKVRLTCWATSSQGNNNKVVFDKGRCKDNFEGLLDFCEYFWCGWTTCWGRTDGV